MFNIKGMMEENHQEEAAGGRGVKRWLQGYPWSSVLRAVATFRSMPAEDMEMVTANDVRELWDRESTRPISLGHALGLCRRCHSARPFGKYDCDSFVNIARDLVKPFLGEMSATLATAVISIVADYVRGSGNELEMNQTLSLILARFTE